MTARYEHRSCLTNLHARSRLFTNTPRREGCRVKKIRTGSPLVSCRSTVSACPFQAMGRHRQAICDRKATPHLRHSSFFLPKQRCRSDILSKFAFEGRFYKLPPQSFFMSVFLRFVILWTLLGSICLSVKPYSSLYPFTHKQIDLKK